MKIIQIREPGGPEALECVSIEAPPVLAGEVRVKAVAIGVGRPDVLIRTGRYKWMPPLPAVIGNEMVGYVVELGDSVASTLLGRPVLVSARELSTRGGCYAEQMVVPAETVIVLPDTIDLTEATTLPNYQLAWGLLHDATRGRLPKRVYLNGAAGGVGGALLQLCSQLGIMTVAGASSEEKRQVALSFGASSVVDTSICNGVEMKPGELAAQVRDATMGQGVDVAFDHVCGPHIAEHLSMLSSFGLLVSYNALIGLPKQDVFAALRGHAAHALGITTYNMHAYDGQRDARRALLQTPTKWMTSGILKPLVRLKLPLEQARIAHEMLDANSVSGKIVLIP